MDVWSMERPLWAASLRKQGLKYREIGDFFGVSAEQARRTTIRGEYALRDRNTAFVASQLDITSQEAYALLYFFDRTDLFTT